MAAITAGSTFARCQEAGALAGNLSRDAVARLFELLRDDDPLVRWQASVSLGRTLEQSQQQARARGSAFHRRSELRFGELTATVGRYLRDADPRRRAGVVDALGFWQHEQACVWLLEALQDDDATVRAAAAGGLGKLKDRGAAKALAAALADPSIWVRRAAADALGAIGAAQPLLAAIEDPSPLVRAGIVAALGHIAASRPREALVRCTRDADPVVRWHAARGLARIGNAASLGALQRLRGDEAAFFGRTIGEVAQEAIAAIESRERGILGWVRKLLGRSRGRNGH